MSVNNQREEYLVNIFRLRRDNDKVSNKMLSEKLELSPPSVTEMLKKLKKDGYIENIRDISLTEKGKKKAKEVLSKHRLWEYFLTETLKYNWKDVHEHAQKFQSITSDDLFEKLNEFLGYPDYCPHGSIIYINNEETNSELVKMLDANPGNHYIVRRITDQRAVLDYCEEIGIKIGNKLQLVDFDKFDNAALIKIGENEKKISPKATTEIYLKEINKN